MNTCYRIMSLLIISGSLLLSPLLSCTAYAQSSEAEQLLNSYQQVQQDKALLQQTHKDLYGLAIVATVAAIAVIGKEVYSYMLKGSVVKERVWKEIAQKGLPSPENYPRIWNALALAEQVGYTNTKAEKVLRVEINNLGAFIKTHPHVRLTHQITSEIIQQYAKGNFSYREMNFSYYCDPAIQNKIRMIEKQWEKIRKMGIPISSDAEAVEIRAMIRNLVAPWEGNAEPVLERIMQYKHSHPHEVLVHDLAGIEYKNLTEQEYVALLRDAYQQTIAKRERWMGIKFLSRALRGGLKTAKIPVQKNWLLIPVFAVGLSLSPSQAQAQDAQMAERLQAFPELIFTLTQEEVLQLANTPQYEKTRQVYMEQANNLHQFVLLPQEEQNSILSAVKTLQQEQRRKITMRPIKAR